jgi:hypothetical protein
MFDRAMMARKLCEMDGYNPDITGTFAIKIIREGRLTDTGHDARRGHVEDCVAPPMWQMYLSKADKLIDWIEP